MVLPYFKLLQAIHHVEILDEAARRGSPPPGMTRKAQLLTSFIKPAAPNNKTLNLLEENTRDRLLVQKVLVDDYHSSGVGEYFNLLLAKEQREPITCTNKYQ
ncbi:hypothetical protein KUCAC02_016805, partial [Chaenocephalus aceratus]